MKRFFPIAVILFLCLLPGFALAEEQGWCGTQIQEIGLSKVLTGCLQQGACDNPSTRDTTSISCLKVRVIVHVIRNDQGIGGVSQATVNATIADMQFDFGTPFNTGIQFDLVATRFHNDSELDTITISEQLGELKNRYAESPQSQCNIYITHGLPTTIRGIGTFPWDAQALATYGGIWLSAAGGVGFGKHIATHEMGHCLGLYHTFQCTNAPVACDNCCYAYASGFEADFRGDLCSDTPPNPDNRKDGPCSSYGGNDCQETPWGYTQPENFMGYANSTCRRLFTLQQAKRMQCWMKNALSGWLDPVDCTPPTVTVTDPNGGEYVSKSPCPPYTITWNASDNVGVTGIEIWLDRTNNGSFEQQIANLSGNPGSYNWTVTGASSDSAKIKVIARDGAGNSASDISDGTFRIGPYCYEKPVAILPAFDLGQNYPNPFNANTNISFSLDAPARVELVVYNILGEKVRTLVSEERSAGSHDVPFDGRDDKGKSLSSGVYFYKLNAGDQVITKQMMLIK